MKTKVRAKRRWRPSNSTEENLFKNYLKSKKVEDYFFNATEVQKRLYPTHIRDYFIYLKINNPDNYLKNPELLRVDNPREELEYIYKIEDDIKKFKTILLTNKDFVNLTPVTRLKKLDAIKSFFSYHRIELKNSFWKDVKKDKRIGNVSYSDTQTPTSKDLSKILKHMNLRAKTIFLMQATSGSRINTILNLNIEDIDYTNKFVGFRIKAENSKNGKKSFKRISPEASELLEEYLKEYDKYFESTIKRSYTEESKRNELREKYKGKLFPVSHNTINSCWNNATRRAGFYKVDQITGKRATMTTHSLKRWFKQQFNKYDRAWSNYFAEHTTFLEGKYDFKDISQEEIDNHYGEGVKYLLLDKIPIETSEEIENLKKDVRILEEILIRNFFDDDKYILPPRMINKLADRMKERIDEQN